MEEKELLEAGLTKNQAAVYLELLKHPGQTGGEIARQLSIDRSFAYGIINSLIDKGLVAYITKENKRIFHATNPENLLKEFEEKRSRVLEIVTKLKAIKESKREETFVNLYEGKAGLKAYVRDFLESDFFCTLGGGGKLNILEVLKYQYPQYLRELKKGKMHGRLITSLENKKIMEKIYKKSEVRIKTLKNLKSDVSFTISRDKLAIYSARDKPFVIVIEDKSISSALKDYFDNIWEFVK